MVYHKVQYLDRNCLFYILMTFAMYQNSSNLFYLQTTPIFFIQIQNVHNLISIINHELDKLYTWFSLNKLSLNASKTNYMVFGRRKINCDVDIKINSNQITRVNKKTFLGIMIDEQLNWKEQIHQVQTGLSRITGVM